ncbi:MAG: MFS transporter [Bacteroidota bacterium]
MDTPEHKSAEKSSPHKWLNPNVVGIGTTSLFSDLSHETATTILPVFLSSLGAPAAALGIVEGVADAISSFAKMGSGYFSDKSGIRKPIAVAGYVVTAIATASFGLAQTWTHVLLGRTLGWFGRGIRNPIRDAILTESTVPEAYGKTFGFERALDTAGAILGPLAALWLITILSYRQVFLLTLAPGMIAMLVFAFVVKAKFRAANPDLTFRASLRNLPSRFKIFLVAVGIFGMGDFAHTLLILRATQILTPANPLDAGKLAISLYVVHNVVYALGSYPLGALGDKIGKKVVLVGGYFIGAAMSVGLLFHTSSYTYLAILFVLGGFYIAVQDALEKAIAAELLPDELRGTGYGTLATVNGIGDFVSSTVVGLLWTGFSPAAGFGYAAILMFLGALALFRLR